MTLVASSEFKPEREKTYIKSMLALGVDGFLIQPSVNFNEISSDLNIDKPIVFFDSAPAGEEQMYVKTDNYESVNATTRKLIRKGYRHFIIVSYNPYILQTRIERSKAVSMFSRKRILTMTRLSCLPTLLSNCCPRNCFRF